MQLIEALHALQYDATHSLEFEAVLFGVLLATCIPSPHVGGGGRLLRHLQTASCNWGLLLLCAGLLIPLEELLQQSAADDPQRRNPN